MNKPMKYSDLYIEISADILEITSLEITEELNEHGIAKLNLITDDINKYKFIYDLTPEKDIKVVSVSDEMIEIIFTGIPVNIEVKSIDDIYYIDLELKSKSFLLDCEIKRRSFQNEKNPIENIFKKVIEEDNNGICFDAVSDGALQNESIIQYDETDWEFIKRVASKLESNIVTNVKDDIPHITIGMQRGNDYDYDTHKDALIVDMEDYLKSHLNFGNWTPEQKTSFCIDSINNYWIYDNILYKNILLTIVKKKTVYNKGMIFFTYWINTESGVRQNRVINEKIQGISIDGKVLDITGDRVKLHLSIDEEQNPDEAFWYKCETAYTAEGNTGFYAMPQKGDSVKLIFPKSQMEDGHVRIINRTDREVNSKVKNPDVKYFGNVYGKEIMFNNSELQLKSNGKIYVNMDSGEGIEITSDESIHIHSDDKARTIGKEVYFRAGEEIHIATTASCILIDSAINLKADNGISGI